MDMLRLQMNNIYSNLSYLNKQVRKVSKDRNNFILQDRINFDYKIRKLENQKNERSIRREESTMMHPARVSLNY